MIAQTKTKNIAETATKKKVKDSGEYAEAVGRRKTSVARVRYYAGGEGGITINDKKIGEYFPTEEMIKTVQSPIQRLNMSVKSKITVVVYGGGINSQAEAIRHGISRAFLKHNPEFKKELRDAGFLTRDPRMKERRKFGLKKARKAPQWSKR